MRTDETDKTDDNGSFYFIYWVIKEKENLIRCHSSYPSHLVCHKD